MKTAQEIYKSEDWFADYQPMLNEFGEIIIQVDDDDYQGDSRLIYKKDGKYGYLQFGWGSCSGCDALQNCDTIDEVQKLMDELRHDIKWFDSLTDLKTYFKERDWELDYCWHTEEQEKFIKEVLNENEKTSTK